MKLLSVFKFSYILFFLPSCTGNNTYTADVIIYGGTSAAVTAAVQIKSLKKSVIIVSPDNHLGGMSSGGLGFSDTGNNGVIGGLAREFYHRIYLYYHQPGTWKWEKRTEYGNKGQGSTAIDDNAQTMWVFEPHAAEEVFENFIAENEIEVHRDEWLDRASGVIKEHGKITFIKTLSGKMYRGKMFIDATYEGDLMAAARVSYSVGREACSVYHENWNGIQAGIFQHAHYFRQQIDPYIVPGDSTSGLLPGISPDKPGKNCSGDNKIQAYCFRMCLTKNSENLVAFPKPEGYNPSRYELLVRVYNAGWNETFHKFDPIPNRKTDTNNHGPFSTDNIGMNYDYPEASYERRREIIKEHENYQKGLMYFLANDPQVPVEVKQEMSQWGLAKDEFTDNSNWPYQIYVREARRMIGKYVMTENDILGKRDVPEPAGMGSYGIDSHHVQRYVTAEGYVQNEGDVGVPTPGPYAIAYGSIVPKANECTNLLVPVCVSASHTAYGSIRMEPVFMALGQSAATAAALAIDRHVNVQDVGYKELKEQLLNDKMILEIK